VLGGTLVINRVTGEDVGEYAITPSGLTSTNYAIEFVKGTFTILPRTLTVTADDQQKVYDGLPFTAFTSQITGFVNGPKCHFGRCYWHGYLYR
jgi:large repetitive protein